MARDFGLSNIYLKVGFALLAIFLLMLATAFFVPSTIRYLSEAAGFCFASGLVLYVIGRIAKLMRSRTQT